jgi:hypothetical protein
VKILHVSDLHITGKWKSLEEIWLAPAALLAKERPFDFIIVSGDLSQRAGAEEYARLHTFAVDELLPLLARPAERSRVVFVPGNHDTLWGATVADSVFRQLSLDEELARSPELVARTIREAREHPEATTRRFALSRLGHGELFEVDPAKRYVDRFTPVQGFLDGFYGGALGEGGHRPFDLLQAAPGHDWSAHAFPAENVIFIGLNSCATNDRFWEGARFAPEAIAAAQKHVATLLASSPHATVVAVWHHGFASELGRPDRLAMGDLGMVYNLGARVGFHGHSHVADGTELAMLDGRMAVVATGSLAAGGAELPEGVGNQLSICELGRGRVDQRVFSLDHQKKRFDSAPRARRLTFGAVGAVRERAAPRCAKQRREWRLNEDGIACVTVKLTRVQPCGSLELDTVGPPFCAIDPREVRIGQSRVTQAIERALSDGRRRFSVELDSDEPVDVSWTYYVSNVAAINAEELSLLPDRREWFDHVEPTEDLRAHVNHLECDELELSVVFGPGVPAPVGVRGLAERHQADRDEDRWQVDEVETRRLEPTLHKERRAVHLLATAPLVGHRYALLYQPGKSGRALEPEPWTLAEKVADLCRGLTEPHLGARLTEATLAALAAEGLHATTFTGLLWNQARRRLLNAFGRFPPQSWTARFACGDGIAGHAFRHSYPVAWTRRMAQRQEHPFINVVYRDFPETFSAYSPRHDWVLSIPLFLGRDGPSIGVVGFAGGKAARDRKLAALTEQIASKQGATTARLSGHKGQAKARGGARADERLKSLVLTLNMAFWTTLAEAKELDADERALSARIRDGLVSATQLRRR